MKTKNLNLSLAAATAIASFALSASSAFAAALTWDTVSGDGTAITSGSGNWNTTAGNTVWNNAGTNVIWSQTSATVATNSAIFAGADGTPDQYVVTLSGTTNAQSITFNNSGYKLTSGTLSLVPTSTSNGAITVAAGKTATINSAITYSNSTGGGNYPAANTVNAGSTLNLGGGATNAQYTFTGTGGTVNITAGTYTANTGAINVATFNQSGGTFNLTPGNNIGYNINSNVQNVAYNLTAGTLSVSGNNTTATVNNAHLGIGNATTSSFTSSLNVSGTGIVNVGTTASRSGEIRIGNNTASNGTLNVTGGTVTVGTGSTANKIYFHKSGGSAGYTAAMTQSAGTVTTNGIQFGSSAVAPATPTTYAATSAANLTLSGGSLYIGLQGITRGTDASTLPVAIKLQGGTLGASDTWSSSLNMKLGAAGTIQAANSATAAKNITLSGILSDDSGAGTLTKTGAGSLTLAGANTFTGATAVNAGALVLGNANALSTSSTLTLASGATLSLTTTPSTVKTLTFTGTGTLNFDLAAGGTGLTVGTSNGVTNSGAAGSIVINITGNAPTNGTYSLISYSGSLQGSGFSAYSLGTAPAGKSYTLIDTGSAIQLTVVADGYYWTGAKSSEWSTASIEAPKNWILNDIAVDYVNDVKVVFDSTATNKTVDITGADVTPQSVLFNSGIYTLQSNTSNKIAGIAPVTVLAAATLKLGTSNVLPDGVGAGTLTVSGTLDLNGNSETVNGFNGTGFVDNTAVSTTSTLTLGALVGGNATAAIRNTGGTLALSKTGDTDVTLSGTNTYNGGTTVSAGRLFISNSSALTPNGIAQVNNGASLVLNSSTPTFAQSITLASGSNLSARLPAVVSNVTLPIPGTVIFNNDDVSTDSLTLSTPTSLTGALTVQVGGTNATTGIATLSGILSGSGSLVKIGPGQLALTSANTFNGGVSIKNGTLESKTVTTTLGTGTVTMGGAGSTGASFITGQNNSNPFIINAPDSGTVVIGANGNGSGYTMSGLVTLNGNLTMQTFNNPVPVAPLVTKSETIYTGSITGTGNLLLNNLGLAANTITLGHTPLSTETTAVAINHTGNITLQGTGTGNTLISATVGTNVTGITQNSATSPMILSGVNTYSGDTTVNAGSLTLAANAQLKFVLGSTSGVNNRITGTGALTLGGNFAIETAAADALATGAWTLVDNTTLTETYAATFTLVGFTEVGSTWEKAVGTKKYSFDEATGILTLTSTASYASWIDSFFPGETNPAIIGAGADPDKDGITNAVELVIGGNLATGMDTALMPTISMVNADPDGDTILANYMLFTYRRSDFSVTAGVTASCETDVDLVAPWTPAVNGVAGVVILTDDNFIFTPAAADTDRVRVFVPRDSNTKLFGRLNVQVP